MHIDDTSEGDIARLLLAVDVRSQIVLDGSGVALCVDHARSYCHPIHLPSNSSGHSMLPFRFAVDNLYQ